MINYYLKSFITSIRKNQFFYSINLIGFLTGFIIFLVILSFIHQEISFDKFHKNADYIYRINSGGYGVTPLCFGEKLHNKVPEISDIVRFSSSELIIVHKDIQTEPKKIYYADKNVFEVFTFKLIQGNKDDVLKEPYSLVISKTVSKQLFGDISPVGEIIKTKKGTIYTITGVMEDIPQNSHLQCDLFSSIETLSAIDENAINCGGWGHLSYVLLLENTIKDTVAHKINTILADNRMRDSNGVLELKLENLKNLYFDHENNKFDGCKHGDKQTVIIYFAVSFLLLFLVIINYINLFIAISSSKLKSLAVKKILGASRNQIITQFIFESLGLSIVSFILTITIINAFLSDISKILNLNLNLTQNWVLLYLVFFFVVSIIGILTGYISGFSISKLKAIHVLKKESFFKSKGIQRKLILVLQLSIVAVLLNSSFIINNQLRYVLTKDLGFDHKSVIFFRLNEELENKAEVLKSSLLKVPGIKNISFSSSIFSDGFGKSPFDKNDHTELCNFISVDPEYIDLYNLTIIEGRNFSVDYPGDFESSCIINEQMRKAFELNNPINEVLGKRKIVGVISDFNFSSLHNSIEPLIIYCDKYNPYVQLKIDHIRNDEILLQIKKMSNDLSPNNNLEFSFLDSKLKELYKSEYDLNNNLKVYSSITLIIALLGIFGLTLFMIKKKYKEIGIRKLFGAKFKDVFLLLTKEYFWIILIANALALPITINSMNKWIANFQYKLDFDYSVYLKTFLIELIFTLFAILLIIFKSHKIDPLEVLKEE